MDYLHMVGGEKAPAVKVDAATLFAGGEKSAIVQKLNGRGERIRTSDPLLPRQIVGS